jgi:hypothetical protein
LIIGDKLRGASSKEQLQDLKKNTNPNTLKKKACNLEALQRKFLPNKSLYSSKLGGAYQRSHPKKKRTMSSKVLIYKVDLA